jgi:hypothetical protein
LEYRLINKVNGSDSGDPPDCADDCSRCADVNRLRLLSERLASRGLATRLVRADDGTVQETDEHFSALVAHNPSLPGRGWLQVNFVGELEWYSDGTGTLDDDDVIGRVVDEAINVLRVSGVRLPRRERS